MTSGRFRVTMRTRPSSLTVQYLYPAIFLSVPIECLWACEPVARSRHCGEICAVERWLFAQFRPGIRHGGPLPRYVSLLLSRKMRGETPYAVRKARLKCAGSVKPQSYAIVAIGRSTRAGSASSSLILPSRSARTHRIRVSGSNTNSSCKWRDREAHPLRDEVGIQAGITQVAPSEFLDSFPVMIVTAPSRLVLEVGAEGN